MFRPLRSLDVRHRHGRTHLGQALAALLIVSASGVVATRADDLPKTPAAALAAEQADRMPPSTFYTIAPLPHGAAGQLIRSAVVTDYALPKGVGAVRILYHSRDAAGKDVAASGVVLIPAGKAPKGGWPVIAWAHGTSGVARICAPSMMKDVYYGTEGLFPMVEAGFAVIAPDYAGLGTASAHQYLDPVAQANDVINAVAAAHRAVANLSPRWVVDGHSEGGGAAWFVAQQEASLKDPNYLGAVAVAGTVNMPWIMHYMSTSRADSFYAVFLAYGIKARFPKFRVEDMLTKQGMAHYRMFTTKGCWDYGYATEVSQLQSKSAAPVLKKGWERNPWVRRWAAETVRVRPHVSRPLLVLAGGADTSVPPPSIEPIVKKACRFGYHLEFKIYPGLDHDPLMDKSTPYQLQWIRDRFAGRPAPDNCSTLR